MPLSRGPRRPRAEQRVTTRAGGSTTARGGRVPGPPLLVARPSPRRAVGRRQPDHLRREDPAQRDGNGYLQAAARERCARQSAGPQRRKEADDDGPRYCILRVGTYHSTEFGASLGGVVLAKYKRPYTIIALSRKQVICSVRVR